MTEETRLAELFRHKLKVAESYWNFVEPKALEAERYFHNLNTNGGADRRGGLNMCRNVFLSWVARLLEDSPAMVAWPLTQDAAPKVKIANLAYQHVAAHEEFDRSDFKTGLRGLKQGTAAQFLFWDPDAGDDLIAAQRDEYDDFVLDDEGEPMMESKGNQGSVSSRDLGATEFCYGPGGNIEKAKWAIVRMTFSREELDVFLEDHPALAESISQNGGEETVGSWVGIGSDQERVYTLYDFWHKSTRGRNAFKGGRGVYHGRGGSVLETDWPLPFQDIPLAVFHVNHIEGSPAASTPAWDLIPIQKEYDKLEKEKEELLRMQRVYMLTTKKIIDQIEKSKNGKIKVDNIGGTQGGVMYTTPPGFPDAITGRSYELVKQGYDTMGLNEALIGAESAKSNHSAKLVAFLNRLDSQKMKGTMLSWKAFQRRRANLVAKLYQHFCKLERVIMIAGVENSWEAESFSGSTFSNIDFRFEQVPGTDVLRSVAAAEAEDDMREGRLDLEAGLERAETGLGETAGQHGNSRVVRQYIDDAMMSPAAVEPPPGMDPMEIIAQAELRRSAPDANASALDEIISRAKQAMAAAQQEQANAQNQNPPR